MTNTWSEMHNAAAKIQTKFRATLLVKQPPR